MKLVKILTLFMLIFGLQAQANSDQCTDDQCQHDGLIPKAPPINDDGPGEQRPFSQQK